MFGLFGGRDDQEVEHESGASRLCSSICCAVCGAPLLMLVSMILLGWNERRAVCEAKAIVAGQDAVVPVGCTSGTQGSGDLVLFACDLDNSSLPQLSPGAGTAFSGLSHRGPGLVIKSEMYQCIENERKEKKKDAVGGGETTITTYSYTTEWRKDAVSSAGFRKTSSSSFRNNCGVGNPSWPAQVPESATLYADSAAVGPFTIDRNFVAKIPLNTPLTVGAVPAGWTVSGSEYSSSQWQVSSTGIGRVKVSFRGYDATAPRMTVLGKNSNGQVGPWTAPSSWLCSGFTLSDLRPGTVSEDRLFENLQAESTGLTWVLRLVGFALFWVAFCLLAGPLEVATDCIPCIGPCLGDSVAAVTGCISCLPATACTMLIVGIVWVAMRPIVGIFLVLAFLCIFGGLAGYKAYAQQNKGEGDGLQGSTIGKESE